MARVFHLDCISSCPLGGKLMDGRSETLAAKLVCHCLLVEGPRGLVLVDTGYGLQDVAHPVPRLSRFFLALLRPELREERTARRQIEGLGYRAEDVRDIVLTHLDFDHAGGLDDFPHAAVHMLAPEQDAALARRTLLDRMRYRPAQWRTSRERWRSYAPVRGEAWFGFRRAQPVAGAGDVVLVPLEGHTLGHAGVAVRGDGGWLLLAGDAYFYRGEMDLRRPHCTPGLEAYQTLMEKDRRLRKANQERLRELLRRHGGEVTVLCSHDAVELETLPRARPAVAHRGGVAPLAAGGIAPLAAGGDGAPRVG